MQIVSDAMSLADAKLSWHVIITETYGSRSISKAVHSEISGTLNNMSKYLVNSSYYTVGKHNVYFIPGNLNCEAMYETMNFRLLGLFLTKSVTSHCPNTV